MNSKKESILLQSEFIDCQKIFTAISYFCDDYGKM